MATILPTFTLGPPPPSISVTMETDSRGNQVYVNRPNPLFYVWTQRLWEWTKTLGNNINGAGFFSGSVTIGTSPNWFNADASGIWLGGATFAASPFRVSMAGALISTSGTFSGSITGASGTFSGSITGASGTFSGDIVTTGHVKASGEYDGGFTTLASVTGSSTSNGNFAGVLGYATGSGAYGVKGQSTNAGGGDGVFGHSAYGYGVRGVATQSGAYAGRFLAEGSAKALLVTGTSDFDGNIDATGYTVTAAFTGNVTGNASGSSGSCTGNALTATTLQNARTIGGTSFNGSANINPIQVVNDGGNVFKWIGTSTAGAAANPITVTNVPTSASTVLVWQKLLIDSTYYWFATVAA